MIADYINFSILADLELDRLINELIQVNPGERTRDSELMGQAASKEWQRRYPDTLSPSFYAYAMKRGGFPTCYTGPRKTVQLDLLSPIVEETNDE
jgi:hypothetical protein